MSTAIVTGAGGGIGAVVARRLVAEGFDVVGWDRAFGPEDPDEGFVRREVDVVDEHQVVAAVDAVEGEVGLLVGCAAVLGPAPLLDLDLDAWDRAMRVNVGGTFLVGRTVARRMAAHGGGAIVNVGSINGTVVVPNAGAYTASKAAVLRLTEQMALEWAPLGIRVNAVSPGFIDAGMNAPIVEVPEIRRAREQQVPLGRLGLADDIADAVVYLGTARSSYVTGQNVVVDGGAIHTAFASLRRS